jgi:hypothetical protein
MNTDFGSYLTSGDVDDLQQVQKLHDLQNEKGSLGSTIVFENLLVPYVLKTSQDPTNSSKLAETMNWIESLSNSDVFEVSNLVAGSFCEPLIASHEDELPLLYPSMGLKTKELCKMQFSRFVVTDETRKMFG